MASTFEVVEFTQPREALAWFQSGASCDAILCDLMMPEMTGMELYEGVARSRPELLTRFIFMSGSVSSGHARSFLSQTTSRVLAKPCSMEELVDEVTAVLAQGP